MSDGDFVDLEEEAAEGGAAAASRQNSNHRPHVGGNTSRKRNSPESRHDDDDELRDFVKRFRPADAKQPRKVKKLPPRGVRKSVRKQGSRTSDVSQRTLRARIKEFPGQSLVRQAGQLHCSACARRPARIERGDQLGGHRSTTG